VPSPCIGGSLCISHESVTATIPYVGFICIPMRRSCGAGAGSGSGSGSGSDLKK